MLKVILSQYWQRYTTSAVGRANDFPSGDIFICT